jgi:hypothetical protein
MKVASLVFSLKVEKILGVYAANVQNMHTLNPENMGFITASTPFLGNNLTTRRTKKP